MGIQIIAEPQVINEGGIVVLSLTDEPDGNFEWSVLKIGATSGTSLGTRLTEYWTTCGPGVFEISVKTEPPGQVASVTYIVQPKDIGLLSSDRVRVTMQHADTRNTPDEVLWKAIQAGAENLSFEKYTGFIDSLISPQGTCTDETGRIDRFLPFSGVGGYEFLKVATEVFLMCQCSVEPTGISPSEWDAYTVKITDGGASDPKAIPYLKLVRDRLRGVNLRQQLEAWDRTQVWERQKAYDAEARATLDEAILARKFQYPCFIELIWSYWHEEGMLVQTMNAISLRFQNRRNPFGQDPLANFELDPLRPLSNLLWGYIQDEQHRLTLPRRNYEYDHQYGLRLKGRAVPEEASAESRTKFMDAFHELLRRCATFFRQDDETTVIADGFPVLNALKEVHLILSEGAHNQYGDLPWTARQEMLMQQWLLGRGEMREFLPTRIMVAYPERWMDRVDAMKKLQGWPSTSVIHYHNLAVFGERLLLSVRFGAWTEVNNRDQAANWARAWRSEIQGYTHAYNTVTGVDLSRGAYDTAIPMRTRRVATAA